MSAHFDIVAPAEPGPLVVEIPHAGLVIDDAAAKFTRIPERALQAGAVLADSDIGADRLWDGSESLGVTRLAARASRYVVDLNTEPRVPTPYEEKLPEPLRAVRMISECGERWLANPLPRHERERRMREVFEPYHQAVTDALEQARARHGTAVLLSSHTFPDRFAPGADVVIGTRHGASADAELRDALADVVRGHELSVALEEPFPGAYSLARHARPAERVVAVQLELARSVVSRREERVRRLLVELVGVLIHSGTRCSSRSPVC